MAQKLIFVIGFCLWLLFLPNIAYVITDIRHLVAVCPVNAYRLCVSELWIMLFFILYGLIGVAAFYFQIDAVRRYLTDHVGRRKSHCLTILVIIICALGVLMGLIDRLNSWDLFLRPSLVLSRAFEYFYLPEKAFNWLIFSLFLFCLYYGGSALQKILKKVLP